MKGHNAMKRSQLLTASAAGALAACTRGATGLLATPTVLLPEARAEWWDPYHGKRDWKCGKYDLHLRLGGGKGRSLAAVQIFEPGGSQVGGFAFLGDYLYGQIHNDFFELGPFTKHYKPGQLIKLFRDWYFRFFKNGIGGTLYAGNEQPKCMVFLRNIHTAHVRVYTPEFAGDVEFVPGHHYLDGPDDCEDDWSGLGIAALALIGSALAWETLVGVLGVAGSIIALAAAQHDLARDGCWQR
jgi:hypothetical protein